MNATEFKTLCPNKAHLTGIELADAMEDYMLQFAKPVKLERTDWMGNKIKIGDTVIIYRTRKFIHGDITDLNGRIVCTIPDDPIWENIGEYKIIDYEGRGAYYNATPDSKYSTLWMMLNELSFGGQPTDIVCIKGVSDNRDEYFKYLEEKK